MIWRNTAQRYGLVASALHWVLALAVIGLLCLGLYMVDQKPSPTMLKLFFWHKSIGITVLALAVLRLTWRLSSIQPVGNKAHRTWERVLARFTHFLLYLALFVMPLSGWIMSSAKGFSVSVFGWFILPDLVGKSKELAEAAEEVHEFAAYTLIGVIALHVAGALKHHLFDRDDTLRRMLPPFRTIVLAMLLLGAANPAKAADWVIDQEQSSLTFQGMQMGAPFEGRFEKWDGEVMFDPQDLENSHAYITIDMSSVTTGSDERDAYIGDEAWLATESFPESSFMVAKFQKTKEYQYIAFGDLTIRDITKLVELPFTLTFTVDDQGRNVAMAKGEVTIQRLDFGVGQGEWKDTQMVGNDVIVRFTVVATEAVPETR